MGQLLPRVIEDTFDSVAQSLFEDSESDDAFMQKYKEHLLKNNPIVLAFMELWLSRMKGQRRRAHAFIGMLTVYKLLESQAEANQLKEEFSEE